MNVLVINCGSSSLNPAAPPESFTAASREAQLLCGRPLHYCSSCSTP